MGCVHTVERMGAAGSGVPIPVALENELRSTPPGPPVKIVVHAISGELILGPKQYPSTIKLSELQADLLSTAFARNSGAGRVQLMHGEQVLERADSIARISAQETVSLTCVFGEGLQISAEYQNKTGYRDWVEGWSLDVRPLESNGQPAIEAWLNAVNDRSEPAPDASTTTPPTQARQPYSSSIARLPRTGAGLPEATAKACTQVTEPPKRPASRGRTQTVQEVHGRDILSELGHHVKAELGEEAWHQLQALLQQHSGQRVHLESRGKYGPPAVGGYRAAVAGHGIEWHIILGF